LKEDENFSRNLAIGLILRIFLSGKRVFSESGVNQREGVRYISYLMGIARQAIFRHFCTCSRRHQLEQSRTHRKASHREDSLRRNPTARDEIRIYAGYSILDTRCHNDKTEDFFLVRPQKTRQNDGTP